MGNQIEVASMYNIFDNATFEFDWTYNQRINSEAFIIGYVVFIM